MTSRAALIGLALFILCCASARGAEKRVALVIGNSAYRESPLANPVNDARAMAEALKELGFEVLLHVDVVKSEMEQAIGAFGEKLGEGSVGLVFYAGHGMQVAGRNYLIPVDAKLGSEQRVKLEAVDAEVVLDQMAAARTRVSLVILDACRNNPFERRFRGASGGLAQMSAPEGALVAYATAPGKVASDGKDTHGLYTGELLKVLRTPGLTVEEVFKRVRFGVSKMSSGTQVPWESSSLTGEFYFRLSLEATVGLRPNHDSSVSASASIPVVDEDAMMCRRLESSLQAADFEGYLADFPNGKCARFARRQMESLKRETSVAHLPPVMQFPSVVQSPSVTQSLQRPALVAKTTFRDVLADGDSCQECPEMVMIPPGSYLMGAASGEEEAEELTAAYRGTATPQHQVIIDRGFAIGKYPITRGQYAVFAQDSGRNLDGCMYWKDDQWKPDGNRNWRSPGFSQTDQHPAVCVSWDDAQAYIQWLSQRTQQTYRLPSEAEWEYVARAGTTGRRYWKDDNKHSQQCLYANGADVALEKVLNWSPVASCNDGYVYTSPVGSFRPNGFGLYDMLGNVSQWMEDCFGVYVKSSTDGEAQTSIGCGLRVIRGGSWSNLPMFLRSANRNAIAPNTRFYYYGFRVARAVPAP
ncbi:formylglycine-generating enzyme [Azospirillaceae bacterium]